MTSAPPAGVRPDARAIAYAATQLLDHVADLVDEGEVLATGTEVLQVLRADAEIAAEVNEIPCTAPVCKLIEHAAQAALARTLRLPASPATASGVLAARIDAADLLPSALLREAAARTR